MPALILKFDRLFDLKYKFKEVKSIKENLTA